MNPQNFNIPYDGTVMCGRGIPHRCSL